jgi:4-hydroxy-3-methylbut-2-en-1-yl diphosphate reductase
MEVVTANSGLCIGIHRAYRGINERALNEGPFTVTHQNSAMEFDTLRRIERRDPELFKRYPGLERVSVGLAVDKLQPDERVVIGFHGLPNEAKEDLAARGVNVLQDMICPFIAKLDKVVERHVHAGYDVAIVGTRDNHHCRTATKIAGEHGRKCFVIERVEDIESIAFQEGQPVVLVGQVTGNTEIFHAVIAVVQERALPIKIMKTMCSDSYGRQGNAVELAASADVVVLVDDGGDGSQSVFEVCSRVNSRVHRLRSKDQLTTEWFENANKVAVVGGILVPEWVIDDVAQHGRGMFNA